MNTRCFLRISFIVLACLYGGLMPFASVAQEASPLTSLAEPLKGFAQEILNQSHKIHCSFPGCRILVTNFVLPDGQTSKFGIQMADALAASLSVRGKSLGIVDRLEFLNFLQRQRLSSHVQSEEPVGRWLAKQLGGNAVLVGKIKPERNGVELSATLLNAIDKSEKPVALKTKLVADTSRLDLSPTDGLDPLNPMDGASNGEKVYHAGVQGVSLPKCFYMPNPSYTDEARAAKFSGIIVLEAFIGADGGVKTKRIVKGSPYGLNEKALGTLNTWKCQPAELDGKPVPVIVPFEVNFRLY